MFPNLLIQQFIILFNKSLGHLLYGRCYARKWGIAMNEKHTACGVTDEHMVEVQMSSWIYRCSTNREMRRKYKEISFFKRLG